MAQTERISKKEVKEDRFVNLILEIYDFCKNNLQTIVIAVGVVIIILAAFSIYRRYTHQKAAEASIAMDDALKVLSEAEDAWTDEEKAASSAEKYEKARAELDKIVQYYGSSIYGDKALFYSAKSSYQIGEYDQAIQNFRQLVDNYPKSLFALYAQQALGQCYEQKGDTENFQKAIEEYAPSKFEQFAELPEQEHVVVQSRFNQAQLYEKLEQPDQAIEAYNQIIETFKRNLRDAKNEKITQMLDEVKALVEEITKETEILDGDMQTRITTARGYEVKGTSYEAYEEYSNAIHLYIDTPEGRDLPQELSNKIKDFDKRSSEFMKNLRDANKYESEDQLSSALYAYDRAVGLNFAPTRKLYEQSLLRHDLLQIALKSLTDTQMEE